MAAARLAGSMHTLSPSLRIVTVWPAASRRLARCRPRKAWPPPLVLTIRAESERTTSACSSSGGSSTGKQRWQQLRQRADAGINRLQPLSCPNFPTLRCNLRVCASAPAPRLPPARPPATPTHLPPPRCRATRGRRNAPWHPRAEECSLAVHPGWQKSTTRTAATNTITTAYK